MAAPGATAGVPGAGDTYLMTDTVEDRMEIPQHLDDPVARYMRLVARVQTQRTM
jgi:hypothetical protein